MPCYVVPALTQELAPDPLDPSQVVSGNPQVSTYELLETEALAVGIWQHTAGVSTDVEVDEIFVVLAGRATIEVAGGPPCRSGRATSASSRQGPRRRGPSTRTSGRSTSSGMTAADQRPDGYVSDSAPSSVAGCCCSRGLGAHPRRRGRLLWSTRSTASSGEPSAAQSSPGAPAEAAVARGDRPRGRADRAGRRARRPSFEMTYPTVTSAPTSPSSSMRAWSVANSPTASRSRVRVVHRRRSGAADISTVSRSVLLAVGAIRKARPGASCRRRLTLGF